MTQKTGSSLKYCSHIWGYVSPPTLALDSCQKRTIQLINNQLVAAKNPTLAHRLAVRDQSLDIFPSSLFGRTRFYYPINKTKIEENTISSILGTANIIRNIEDNNSNPLFRIIINITSIIYTTQEIVGKKSHAICAIKSSHYFQTRELNWQTKLELLLQ